MFQETSRRYLSNRIVYCANCETNRLLANNRFGPECSVCQSVHWVHVVSTPFMGINKEGSTTPRSVAG